LQHRPTRYYKLALFVKIFHIQGFQPFYGFILIGRKMYRVVRVTLRKAKSVVTVMPAIAVTVAVWER
jgi:hypothetical protein